MDGARMVVSSDSYRDRRTFMKNIATDVLSGKCEDGNYYISKAWYAFNCPVTYKFVIIPFLHICACSTLDAFADGDFST